MSRGPRLALLGKQGAGKGTQAELLAAHFGVVHFSTGDLFRSQAADGTAFGLEAKRFMDAGELVPDEVVLGVVEECLAPGGPLAGGFILDGFPRTLEQARALERALDHRTLDVVITIDVPREVVLDRISGRRVCSGCQRIVHVDADHADDPMVCDHCGGTFLQRDDDTEQAIDRRLELYDQRTAPIVDFYRASGQLVIVDGVGDTETVFARILAAVEPRVGSRAS